jgi:glutamate synthase (NADPH/NADH) large chain
MKQMNEIADVTGLPKAQGLYDPSNEHDACGIGFVANVSGEKSHDIILNGLQVLINLAHRGASGCDSETGDGAGVLIQIPHEFFKRECAALGFDLPPARRYGVGMLFFPVEKQSRLVCEGVFERVVREEGLAVLGWRDTPVDGSAVGRVARASQPYIQQIFIGSPESMDEAAFERRLYVVRRRVENEIAASDVSQKEMFYVPSLSCRTIIYKGLLLAPQIARFYQELKDPEVHSALCLVHQRFSTNTFPTWHLAHPYRYVAHNGEINTVKGNVNWMNARESVLASPLFGDDIQKLFPIVQPGGSDSASFDNVLELLVQSGRSLPHAMTMMIPEACSDDTPQDRRNYYEYHASLMEPWDGPAAIAFTDGRVIGAMLDRNGLRPARYTITKDGVVVMASEAGVLPIAPENIRVSGRVQPGRMFLVDTEQQRIIGDDEIKTQLANRQPYGQWLKDNQLSLDELPEPFRVMGFDHETIVSRQRLFGYTDEDLKRILLPMAADGQEPIGSMGNDTPLACLSDQPQLLFNYFRVLFAQVTNPPIDPIREEIVMSLSSYIGQERNILDEQPINCHTLRLKGPILTNRDLERLRRISQGDFLATTMPILYRVEKGKKGLEDALHHLCRRTSLALKSGYTLLILSDRDADEEWAPIPSLLALAAVHSYLVRERKRSQCAVVIESGEPREVMHFALLLGYGASAVNPYLAIETLEDLANRGDLPENVTFPVALKHFKKAINKGLLKTFSKMGISTLQSYTGAQVFEAIGLNKAVVQKYFSGTPSRIEGVGLDVIARESQMRHQRAFSPAKPSDSDLTAGGTYAYRANGERHLLNPTTISKLQHAVRQDSAQTFQEYTDYIDNQNERLCTLRGLMRFKKSQRPVPIEEVEPASAIVRRFATGAMSFGSISKEAHEALARAMNAIGGKSNTGEGGEDEARFADDRRSAIKQVASGRFGVTTHYLVNADELQIKMAQGAKPGEGGQLPGHKVDQEIARVRRSIPGVGLISPPPHHDIYSIEDLAQLIYDLKNVNPKARISVKLVAEVGVGTVAAGVAKAHADVILISGDSGGTGASPLSSIKHAGVPWELGLAETQQVLVMNDLRGRVRLQTDGKLQTGRDVVIAALLGAEEFGFATTPLIALGCVMMRKCHLNTCPVGIATQDPVLRGKFQGQPEHVIRFFFFLAEQVRAHMAALGFRTMDEMIGRVDMLEFNAQNHWKTRGLDFSSILHSPPVPARVSRRRTQTQDHGLHKSLDYRLMDYAREALDAGQPTHLRLPIRNVHRSVGAMISGEVVRRFGPEGLPDDTIRFDFEGSAGQSFGAFLANGITMQLEGDANDYVGKGLSGGRLVVFPPKQSTFDPARNIVIGNVALYGATSGEAFFNGVAGERFAVRNSGATAVVEGVGDHGCEYMTRGVVVVLGDCGRNFAAGMSGGLAYVFDERGDFAVRSCNRAGVDLDALVEPDDMNLVRGLVERHHQLTGSRRAAYILENWPESVARFIKVFPHEYKRALGLPLASELMTRVEPSLDTPTAAAGAD